MANQSSTNHRPQLTDVIAAIVIVASIGLSVLGWRYVEGQQRTEAQQQFTLLAQDTTAQVVERLSRYSDALYSLRAYFYSTDDINTADWQQFIANQRTFDIYPGIDAIGYIQRVEPGNLDQFVAAVRADDSFGADYTSDFEVFPEPTDDDTLHVARFGTTATSDRPEALGFNLASQPTRRETIQQTAQSGTLSASAPLQLVDTGAPGFQIFLPVYENDHTPATAQQRTAELDGHLLAVFDADKLLQRFSDETSQGIAMSVSDGSTQLFSDMRATQSEPQLMSSHKVDVSGRDWKFSYQSTPDFERTYLHRSEPLLALAVGGTFTLLLIFMTQRRYRHHLRNSH